MRVKKVYGPPGCGKTTRGVAIVEGWVAGGVPLEAIGYVSHTNAAVDAALDRLRAAGVRDPGEDGRPYFRTLHSTACRLLGVGKSQILSHDDLRDFSRASGFAFDPYLADATEPLDDRPRRSELNAHLEDWGNLRMARASRSDPEAMLRSWPAERRARIDAPRFLRCVREYEGWKASVGQLDFADMVIRAIEAGVTTGCSHVVLDEAQDCSLAQWRLFDGLFAGAGEAVLIGDDDQSIYSWAGGDPRLFLEREGEVEVLSQSYRVPWEAHALAHRIITRNRGRQEKAYRPAAEEGTIARRGLSSGELADPNGRLCVLARNKRHLGPIAERCFAEGIPFGSPSVRSPYGDRVLCRGVYAAHRLREAGTLGVEPALWLATLAAGARGPEVTVFPDAVKTLTDVKKSQPAKELSAEELAAWVLTEVGRSALRRDPFDLFAGAKAYRRRHFDALRTLVARRGTGALLAEPRLFLSTAHAAKGREWETVAICQDATRRCMDGIAEDASEENRLKYVAVTRTRRDLILMPETAGGWAIR